VTTRRFKPKAALTPEQAQASYLRAEALYVLLSSRDEIPFASEQQFQGSLMTYIDRRHPIASALTFHVPLELLRRDDYTAGLFHRLGARAGVADVVMLLPRGAYHGLTLELKVPKRRPTESQLNFLEKTRSNGYASAWTDSFDSAVYLIDAYLALPTRAQIAELMPRTLEASHEHRRRRKASQANRPDPSTTEPAADAGAVADGATPDSRSG
jgi:hypothetical protein